jgi:hypothetical protein
LRLSQVFGAETSSGPHEERYVRDVGWITRNLGSQHDKVRDASAGVAGAGCTDGSMRCLDDLRPWFFVEIEMEIYPSHMYIAFWNGNLVILSSVGSLAVLVRFHVS